MLYTDKNHSSAQQFSRDIKLYLDNEVAYNAMYGPFTEKPINMHISPLMTREKPGSDNRRTIVDLSWPHSLSVNHGVAKNKYLQAYYHLSYPSVDHIVDHLKHLGPGALIYKVDISRAFRHLRIEDLGTWICLVYTMDPIIWMDLWRLDLDMDLFSFRNVWMQLGT